ncbi:BspA family leucine-rich repeat surface protein, partial [Muribaculaceae bacterium Isolate-077 (Janvier)]
MSLVSRLKLVKTYKQIAIISVSTIALGATLSTIPAKADVNTNAAQTSKLKATSDNITTGTWGTSAWTFDDSTGTLDIGPGTLGTRDSAPFDFTNGDIDYNSVKTINITGSVTLPQDSSGLFTGLGNLTALNGFDKADTSNVTNFHGLFYYDSKLDSVDLSHMNTSNATDMSYMFAFSLFRNLDLSKFNTSKVTSMDSMFLHTPNLVSVNLSSFDTANVESMLHMFNSSAIKSLNLKNFNTSKVTTMDGMFQGDSSLTNLDISGFDTSQATTDSMLDTASFDLRDRKST